MSASSILRRLIVIAEGALILGALLAVSGVDVGEAENAPRDLPFFYDLLTFKGEDGGTKVVAAVAVPVRELRRERVDGEVRYRFDVRFVLADPPKGTVVETIDSVFVSVPRALSGRHLLHTAVELPDAPPSRTTEHRLVVTDATRPGVGQLYQDPFRTPDYRGSEMILSDLAFGLPGAAGGWTRRKVTLALLPTDQFPESEFDIYYEVYNLPAGNEYETEIAIERLDDDDANTVRARFAGESESDPFGTLGELRRVESALERGRYRITVTVRDLTDDREASRSRVVEVTGWRRGTTMVRALPKRAPIGSR